MLEYGGVAFSYDNTNRATTLEYFRNGDATPALFFTTTANDNGETFEESVTVFPMITEDGRKVMKMTNLAFCFVAMVETVDDIVELLMSNTTDDISNESSEIIAEFVADVGNWFANQEEELGNLPAPEWPDDDSDDDDDQWDDLGRR